eukprot:CAMPEP_0171082762 /NCGR_PEP_ID=MMETSP0766_2-20121228/17313_1 /TAXON_ID=439317 /ORGANISM="Gambierdiscus australes, Strain CAWD 149" /LENGTH=47 /DNA_ID= /DNA_START= /DNA_END= /DNA_ORIENTATION=
MVWPPLHFGGGTLFGSTWLRSRLLRRLAAAESGASSLAGAGASSTFG